jgi:hypothetical protein
MTGHAFPHPQRLSQLDMATDSVRVIVEWLATVVAAPVPGGGPQTALCPWAVRSLDLDCVYLSVVDGEPDGDDIAAQLRHLGSAFASFEPASRPASVYRCAGILFTRQDRRLYSVLDALTQDLKNEFLERGLLLGRFHEMRRRVSRRRPGQPAMTSPRPLIMLRELVAQDRYLLDNVELPPGERRDRLERLNRWLELSP